MSEIERNARCPHYHLEQVSPVSTEAYCPDCDSVIIELPRPQPSEEKHLE